MTGSVVKRQFDGSDGGPNTWVTVGACLSALIAIVAAGLQVPFKLIASRYGKVPIMLAGLLAFVSLSLIILLLDEEQLGSWAVLVPLYLLQASPDPSPSPS